MEKPVRGSVELYRLGLALEQDPGTTHEDWERYREELRRANVAFSFRTQRKQSIEVIKNESTESPEA